MDVVDVNVDYGFQSEWDDEEPDEEDLKLQATMLLFDSLSNYPGHEESIERFCLPIFSAAGSDYAVDHVLDSIKKRPSMSQIYAAYVAKFLKTAEVQQRLLSILNDASLGDWQKMWILAALLQAEGSNDIGVKVASGLVREPKGHDALRAVAAIYVGRFGDHSRRKVLSSIYGSVSNYIQAAIYYSSRTWPSVERSNAKASWSGHSQLHSLIREGMDSK